MPKLIKKPKAPNPPPKPSRFFQVSEDISFGWEQEIDLNKFLKLFPKGIKRKDIKLTVTAIGTGDECKMYLTASYVGKQRNPNYKLHLEQYNQQFQQYEKKMKVYQKKLEKYNYAVVKAEIKNYQKELQSLKRQLKRMENNV